MREIGVNRGEVLKKGAKTPIKRTLKVLSILLDDKSTYTTHNSTEFTRKLIAPIDKPNPPKTIFSSTDDILNTKKTEDHLKKQLMASMVFWRKINNCKEKSECNSVQSTSFESLLNKNTYKKPIHFKTNGLDLTKQKNTVLSIENILNRIREYKKPLFSNVNKSRLYPKALLKDLMLIKKRPSNNLFNLKEVSLIPERIMSPPLRKKKSVESTLKQQRVRDERSFMQRATKYKITEAHNFSHVFPAIKFKCFHIRKRENGEVVKRVLNDQENTNNMKRRHKKLVIDLTMKVVNDN